MSSASDIRRRPHRATWRPAASDLGEPVLEFKSRQKEKFSPRPSRFYVPPEDLSWYRAPGSWSEWRVAALPEAKFHSWLISTISPFIQYVRLREPRTNRQEAPMFPKGEIWDVVCELARFGAYENIVTIERELRRRALLNGMLTHNTYWREYFTRLCHAARDGSRQE